MIGNFKQEFVLRFIYILKTPSDLQIPVFVHSHHEHLHAEDEKFGLKTPIYIDHLVCF